MDLHKPAHNDGVIENPADIELNKPSKSRFLFLLFLFGFLVFANSGCLNLWEHKFVPNNDVKVPENTTYDPKYK